MAKKGSRERTTPDGANASNAMVDFAEDLGRLLGTAQAKASNWLNQRKDVIDELTQLRDTANQLLRDLTGDGAARGRGAKRGRPRAANGGSVSPAAAAASRTSGRRRMSAAERKAVSDRMRRYWAARRKAKATQA
jgi:hypothetical protein